MGRLGEVKSWEKSRLCDRGSLVLRWEQREQFTADGMAITQEPAVWSLFDHTVKRANHTTFPPPRDAHCSVHSDPKDALSLVRSGSLGFKCLVGQMLWSPLVLC